MVKGISLDSIRANKTRVLVVHENGNLSQLAQSILRPRGSGFWGSPHRLPALPGTRDQVEKPSMVAIALKREFFAEDAKMSCILDPTLAGQNWTNGSNKVDTSLQHGNIVYVPCVDFCDKENSTIITTAVQTTSPDWLHNTMFLFRSMETVYQEKRLFRQLLDWMNAWGVTVARNPDRSVFFQSVAATDLNAQGLAILDTYRMALDEQYRPQEYYKYQATISDDAPTLLPFQLLATRDVLYDRHHPNVLVHKRVGDWDQFLAKLCGQSYQNHDDIPTVAAQLSSYLYDNGFPTLGNSKYRKEVLAVTATWLMHWSTMNGSAVYDDTDPANQNEWYISLIQGEDHWMYPMIRAKFLFEFTLSHCFGRSHIPDTDREHVDTDDDDEEGQSKAPTHVECWHQAVHFGEPLHVRMPKLETALVDQYRDRTGSMAAVGGLVTVERPDGTTQDQPTFYRVRRTIANMVAPTALAGFTKFGISDNDHLFKLVRNQKPNEWTLSKALDFDKEFTKRLYGERPVFVAAWDGVKVFEKLRHYDNVVINEQFKREFKHYRIEYAKKNKKIYMYL